MSTKTCTRCHEEKSLAEFFFSNRNRGSGYSSICLACVQDTYAASKPKTELLIQRQEDLAKRGWEEKRNALEKERGKKVVVRQPRMRSPMPVPDVRVGRTGYVYLMASENGLYKVGRSRNVESRLGELNRAIPINVHLVHSIKSENYVLVEEFLHTKFAERWVKYEWFRLTQAEVDWLCSLVDFGLDNLLPEPAL